MPREITPERLQQAAIDELLKHGGSQRDIEQLKAQFQKADEEKSSSLPEIPKD